MQRSVDGTIILNCSLCELCFPVDESCSNLSYAGGSHTVLVRSDGAALAFGHNGASQCDLPDLAEAS